MRPLSCSIALVAALLCAAASGCYHDREGRETQAPASTGPAAAPAAEAPAAPAPDPSGATPAPAADAGGTVSPPLESGHAPFLSRLPAGAGSPHGDAAPHGDASPHGGAGPHSGTIALLWDTPAGWVAEQPRNPMRRAQYRLPGRDGAADGECAVFYFGPGQGGDAQGNVERWVAMLSKPDGSPVQGKVSEQKIGPRTVTRVEAAGTYHAVAMTMGGEPPPPQPGWLLLGAVVPGPDANWFFRCAGPEKTIAAQRGGFDALLASVREAPE